MRQVRGVTRVLYAAAFIAIMAPAVSRSKLAKLLDVFKALGDIPEDFSIDRLFLPGVTRISN